MHRLSSIRLSEIASFILPKKVVADIGSDHGYLPIFLAQTGEFQKIIAGEVSLGPYHSALNNVQKIGVRNIVDVRLGNGLSVLELDEVEIIVIAGMGGKLITDILETGKEKLNKVIRLILQPNVAEHHVRRWLYYNKYQIIAEKIIKDDNHIYEIIVAEPIKRGENFWIEALRETEYDLEELFIFGPILLKKKSGVFIEKWEGEMNKIKLVLEQLSLAKEENSKEKISLFTRRLQMIEEVIRNVGKGRNNYSMDR